MDRETVKSALKEAIYQRRSSRAFTSQPVPKEVIEEILEAGRHAPSASNQQATHFYVITNAGKLSELKIAVTSSVASIRVKSKMAPSLQELIKRAQGGVIDVTYGAPVLIVTTNLKDSINAMSDCACALQNMMLTASVHGIGNCWINQFMMFKDARPLKNFFAGLGMSKDEEICGALVLGYTDIIEKTPLPRTGNPVTYIR
jgi:nitroreductase